MPQAAPAIAYRRAGPADALCVGVLAMQVFLDTYATRGIRPDLAREALGVHGVEAIGRQLQDPDVQLIVAEGSTVAFVEPRIRPAARCRCD